MVELNGDIYAIIGHRAIGPADDMIDDNKGNYVEKYNIETTNWESVCPLSLVEGYFTATTAVAFKGMILMASHTYGTLLTPTGPRVGEYVGVRLMCISSAHGMLQGANTTI